MEVYILFKYNIGKIKVHSEIFAFLKVTNFASLLSEFGLRDVAKV